MKVRRGMCGLKSVQDQVSARAMGPRETCEMLSEMVTGKDSV